MDPPRNRKQRRAARSSSPSIPLAHPSREAPKSKEPSKTLVDLIAERQATPAQNLEFLTIDPSGLPDNDDLNNNNNQSANTPVDILPDQPLPPLVDTVLLSLPLSTLHLTLAFLAAHQYADKTHLPSLVRESALVAFPMLTLLIHLAHGHLISFGGRSRAARRQKTSVEASLFPMSRGKLSPSFLARLVFPPSLRTSVFLPVAVLLGAKLVTVTNEDPYYAVMKRAPAIGTLWVWSILEIPLGAAILGALGPLGWGVWWKGYGIV